MMKIDKDKNQEFYNSFTPCDCAYCRNFYIQIKSACKDLTDFFHEYNIDIAKPFELISIESDRLIEYASCQYLVFGECSDKLDISVGGINITRNIDCHPSTKEYDRPHFILDFSVSLPYLIEE